MPTLTKTQTVRDAVADQLANDASPDRAEAERLYVAERWPLLSARADMEDDLLWHDLLGFEVSEADSMESDERRDMAGEAA